MIRVDQYRVAIAGGKGGQASLGCGSSDEAAQPQAALLAIAVQPYTLPTCWVPACSPL